MAKNNLPVCPQCGESDKMYHNGKVWVCHNTHIIDADIEKRVEKTEHLNKVDKYINRLEFRIETLLKYIKKHSPCNSCEHDCYCKKSCDLKKEWKKIIKDTKGDKET